MVANWSTYIVDKEFVILRNVVFDEDFEELDISDEEEVMEFTKSECTCSKCVQMNAVSLLWDRWEPDTPMNKILKSPISPLFLCSSLAFWICCCCHSCCGTVWRHALGGGGAQRR